MPIFLAEDEIGFDSTLVGFPTLGGCMAVAMQSPHGLFGFHIPPAHESRSPKFAEFCSGHQQFGEAIHLYGSCKWNDRYGGDYSVGDRFLQWVVEMKKIAGLLNYRGTVSGFDITSATTGLTTVGSAYLEYQRDSTSGSVAIHYAHMDEVDAPRDYVDGTEVRKILPNQDVKPPYKNKITVNVTPKAGHFSAAGSGGFFAFEID